jgi:hypothetical protein
MPLQMHSRRWMFLEAPWLHGRTKNGLPALSFETQILFGKRVPNTGVPLEEDLDVFVLT